MLLKMATLRGIEDGSVTLAFRRWRRPTVKPGGTLLTAVGQLAVESVEPVEIDSITAADAIAAGFASLEELSRELARRDSGQVFRVRLSLAGPDPRIALRETVPEGEELEELVGRLRRLDDRSREGPWTGRVLGLLAGRPEERAADLAPDAGLAKDRFKRNVRKLKAMGLTESMGVGYRLSPRGRAVLDRIRAGSDTSAPDAE